MDLKKEGRAFLAAIEFLTRIPVRAAWSEDAARASLKYYPAVGAGLGLVAGLAFVAVSPVFGATVSAILAIALTMVLTGALHEDGLADTWDGMGASRDSALDVMRDSRLGSFGALSLVVALGLKSATLSSLVPAVAVLGLIAAHSASRGLIILAMALHPYARAEGAAASVSSAATRSNVAMALALSAAALVGLGSTDMALPIIAVAGLALALILHAFHARRLGGYTGDTLGALQQYGEVAVLLAALALAT
ncbi:MAG: adenosylcobinamide-GDP ribazoletransferase [Pseudomonadota bacterium]